MALTPEFKQKVDAIEQRLKHGAGSLLAVMSFETGGTFDPAVKNRAGQWGDRLNPVHAVYGQGLRDLAQMRWRKMSAEEQLEYVEKYFQPYKGKMGTLEGCVYGGAVPEGHRQARVVSAVHEGTKAYEQNAGLDRDKKGMVTVADAVAMVQQRSGEAPAPPWWPRRPAVKLPPRRQTPRRRWQPWKLRQARRAQIGRRALCGHRTGGTGRGRDWSTVLFG